MKKLKGNHTTIEGRDIIFYKADNDTNGNPRYVVHFLQLGIEPKDYGKIKIAARKYNTRQFAGGYVFQSWHTEFDLMYLLDQVKNYYAAKAAE